MAGRLFRRAGSPISLTIRGARLLDPAAGIDRVADLTVTDGMIAENDAAGGDGGEVVDGEGMIVVPGFVDPHVHLRTPGREDTEDIQSGTRAAAAGGFVAIVAMPNTNPPTDSPAVLGSLIERCEAEAVIGVGFLPAITVAQRGEELTEQAEMTRMGAVGFSDDGVPVADAEVMRRALQYQRITGRPLVLHEEDPRLSGRGVVHEGPVATRLGLAGIPAISESIAVSRDIVLAEYEDGAIHICHVSARQTVEEIRRGKERGVRVTAEVSPHHLILTDAAVAELDPARHKMNPPLRSEDDRRALIAALIDGTIDCIATDHAPHAVEEKEEPFERAPFGVTGLETAFAACHTYLVGPGELSLELLVRRMSADAAGALGLPAPTLAAGAPADLALIDLAAEWAVGDAPAQSRSRNSAFLGETLRGQVRLTVAGGQLAWRL